MSKVHIVNACFVGSLGLADYTLSLARSLSSLGRSTIVTARDFHYPSVPFGGEVIRLFRRSRHYPIDLVRFTLRMLNLKPDVVVLQAPLKWPLLDALAVRLLRGRGIRMATTVHDVLPHYPNAWSPFVYRYFYKSFDQLIAHSESARTRIGELGVSAPTLVVPHGSYDIYRLAMPDRTTARRNIGGLASDEFVVLFFGQIDERKGIAELLDVIEASKGASRIKFLIAGGVGISDPALRGRLTAAGEASNCRVEARRIPFDQVENFFLAADAVVLPYKEGTTSGVLKLAMAFGRPVIATDVGDVPETVPRDAGVVISHLRVRQELPEALAQMEQNHERFARRWRDAVAMYEWQVIGRRYFEFLTKNLSQVAVE